MRFASLVLLVFSTGAVAAPAGTAAVLPFANSSANSTTAASNLGITVRDADAMNGDAKAVESYLKKIIPPEVCAITNVKVDAKQVIYTAACTGAAARVVTTSYRGDSFDATDTAGTKTTVKLTGPCK